MDKSPDEKIFEQLRKAKRLAVCLPQSPRPDVLAAGLGLKLFLEKLQKDVSLLAAGALPEQLAFLPGFGQILDKWAVGKSLVVIVGTKDKKLAEISYQTKSDRVEIYLKAQGDKFIPGDLSFGEEKFPLDLLVTLGVGSLEQLGELYTNAADIFFETPVLNIDNHLDNEYFGALNLVEPTATAVSEILAELLQRFEKQLLDGDIATCLLAGIIHQTSSFQHPQTTPKAFLQAGELINLGGRQQEIVKHIYKTKSLPLLKLWGRALAKMKIQEQQRAVYTVLNQADFERAGAEAGDLFLALQELSSHLPEYKFVAILAQIPGGQCQLFAAVHQQLEHSRLWSGLLNWGSAHQQPHSQYLMLELDLGSVSLDAAEQKLQELLSQIS